MTTDPYDRPSVEHLPAVAYTVANELPGRILFISEGIEEQSGYPASRWVQDPDLWASILHPEDRDRVLAEWESSFRAGTPFVLTYRVQHRDGRTVWLLDRLYPHRDEQGEIHFWEGTSEDISAQREAERTAEDSRARFRTLAEQLPVVVYSVSDELEPATLYMSPNALDMLGYPPERFVSGELDWIETVHPDDRNAAWEAWKQAILHGRRFDVEYRLIRSDGSEIWVRDTCKRVQPVDERPAHWQGVMLDVTTEKLAEHDLRASEIRYRKLVEHLPAIVYIDTDEPSPRTVYVSPNVERILGYSVDHYLEIGDGWTDLLHRGDRRRVLEAWSAAVRSGEPFHCEYRFTHSSDKTVWVRDDAALVRDTDGVRLHWQGVLLDVTAEVEAERERAESEARYHALVEGIPAVVYEMWPDDERRTLYTSPHVEALLGYTREEWLDQPDIWIELLHPDDREIELDAHDRQSETGEPWVREYRLIASDGRVVWVRDQASLVRAADGRPITWQGVLFDITAQKEAEEQLRNAKDNLELRVLERTADLEEANELMALEIGERRRVEGELREAEARFRHLVEDSPAVVYSWQVRPSDDGQTIWYMSPKIQQLLGYTAEEWNGGWGIWRDRVHPHDRARVTELALRSEQTGEPFEAEYRYLSKDGSVVWVMDRATLLSRNRAGEPLMFLGVVLDITDLKEAARRAAEIEERFRRLADQAPAVTYAFELPDGDAAKLTVTFVSPQIGAILGQPVSLWQEDPAHWFEMIHPDDRERVGDATAQNWSTGAPWDIEYRMLAADGRVVWLGDRGRCVERLEDGRPTAFVGVMVDITDRKEHVRWLESEEARLRELVEGIPAIPWTEAIDRETGWERYLYLGPQVYDVLGYTPEELLAESTHFPRLVHPEDLERVMATSADAEETGLWEDIYRVLHRDGTTRWLHGRGRRIGPPGVSPAIWQGVTVDVTAQVAQEGPTAVLSALGSGRRGRRAR